MSYYDQEQESLDPDNTVLDEVWDASPDILQTEIRNALAMFLLKGKMSLKEYRI